MHHSTVVAANMGAVGRTRTGGAVGFPTTGYPIGGGTPWVLVSGCLTAGAALLFLAWRLRSL
jgi:hypothetical protein